MFAIILRILLIPFELLFRGFYWLFKGLSVAAKYLAEKIEKL